MSVASASTASTPKVEGAPPSPKKGGPRIYKGKEIHDFISGVSEDVGFGPIGVKDVENECMRILGAPNGGKLTKSIAESQAIRYGFDKAGLSMKLNIPLKAGSKLEIKISTWVVPAHSGYEICETTCFGVGMIPYGVQKEEEDWGRGAFQSSISHGIQFYASMDMGPFFGSGGFDGFAALMALEQNGGDPMQYSYDVLEDGRKTRSLSGRSSKMTLAPVVVQIIRDTEGNSTFDFSHGSKHATVTRKDDGKDMQLYLNCLGWADNNTYVRFDEITIDPALNEEEETAAKEASVKKDDDEEEEEEEEDTKPGADENKPEKPRKEEQGASTLDEKPTKEDEADDTPGNKVASGETGDDASAGI